MVDVNNPDASAKTPADSDTDSATAREKIAGATGAAKEKISGAATGAKRRFSEAGDSVKSAASGARKKFDDVKSKVGSADYSGMSSDARAYVRENPGKAILIAAAAGFLVGLLLRGSEEE